MRGVQALLGACDNKADLRNLFPLAKVHSSPTVGLSSEGLEEPVLRLLSMR
jgi:hypothetical protein